jgi:hypothetical protein
MYVYVHAPGSTMCQGKSRDDCGGRRASVVAAGQTNGPGPGARSRNRRRFTWPRRLDLFRDSRPDPAPYPGIRRRICRLAPAHPGIWPPSRRRLGACRLGACSLAPAAKRVSRWVLQLGACRQARVTMAPAAWRLPPSACHDGSGGARSKPDSERGCPEGAKSMS